ncbi:MAG TPA: hypothetical protein VEA92_02150 [Candidatus Paceibacterota bacterium]|nr:hypothetical protein [Candidatus Paceibacterota bacterium]
MNQVTIPDNILDALNFTALEEEEQQELLLSLHELIFKSTFVRLLERMDEATREEFGVLMDRDASEEEVQGFIELKVPDADSAVMEAVQELTNDILTLTRN